MKMRDVKIGQRVRLKAEQSLYYGRDYAGNPFAFATAGAVGVVGAVDVPPVTGNRANFCCIDVPADQCRFDTARRFLRPFEQSAIENSKVWRCGVRAKDFELV